MAYRSRLFLLLSLLVLMIAGCGTPAPPAPTFSGQLLALNYWTFTLHRFTADPRTGAIHDEVLLSNVLAATASADKQYLVIATGSPGDSKRQVSLMRLSDFTTQPLGQLTGITSFRWSPDGSKLAYETGLDTDIRLVVYYRVGDSAQVIAQAPVRGYVSSSGRDVNVYGAIDLYGSACCAGWPDNTTMLFRRFGGSFPPTLPEQQLPSGPSPPIQSLPADTSTLATIPAVAPSDATTVHLEDSTRDFELIDVSADGSSVLLKESLPHNAVKWELTAPFHSFAELSPRTLSVSGQGQAVGFIPGTTDVWGFERTSDGARFFRINGDSLSKTMGPTFPSDWTDDWQELLLWIGSPDDHVVCFRTERDQLLIGDLDTGGQMALPITVSATLVQPLVWLP